jgi:hypothetical protein
MKYLRLLLQQIKTPAKEKKRLYLKFHCEIALVAGATSALWNHGCCKTSWPNLFVSSTSNNVIFAARDLTADSLTAL